VDDSWGGMQKCMGYVGSGPDAIIVLNDIQASKNINLDIAKSILNTNDAMTIKALGRKVVGYDEITWSTCRFKVVVNGNYLEFTQNKEMMKILLDTDDRELVEASPKDKIWGIGLGQDNPRSLDITQWNGQNLLGKVLNEIQLELLNK
jgi:ribA/ribD-fused uncharacterized protein